MCKKIIIIGAGIGGLSTGCYAQMNGYDTEIFEMHNISGGLCTGWRRKGYNIDGCISFLTGTNSSTNFYKMWSELGVTEKTSFYHHDEIIRLRQDSKEVILYTDLDKLQKHMLETAPEDEAAITELIKDVRKIQKFNPPIDNTSFSEKIKMIINIMPYISIFGKYRISIKEYCSRFKNELLRKTLTQMYFPEFPAIFMLVSLANQSKKNSGVPAGGSLALAELIEKRYLSLGGKINFKVKVSEIIVRDNKAVGIRLEDGREHYADIVVSASDGHNTLFKLLPEKYVGGKIKDIYASAKIFTPSVRIYLGLNEDLSKHPHTQILELKGPISVGGEKISNITVQHYCHEKTSAPVGKSLIRVSFNTTYDYWNKLYKDRELYLKEKQNAADIVLNELEKWFEGIKDKVEMTDVVTPMTYERYTGNWQGSYMGWMPTPETMSLKIDKTLEGLDNFYMAGQWLEALGGLPSAAMSGRDVIKLICRKDKKKFLVSIN